MQPQLLMLGVGLTLELQLTCENCTSFQLLRSKLALNVVQKSSWREGRGVFRAMEILNSPSISDSVKERVVLYNN